MGSMGKVGNKGWQKKWFATREEAEKFRGEIRDTIRAAGVSSIVALNKVKSGQPEVYRRVHRRLVPAEVVLMLVE